MLNKSYQSFALIYDNDVHDTNPIDKHRQDGVSFRLQVIRSTWLTNKRCPSGNKDEDIVRQNLLKGF